MNCKNCDYPLQGNFCANCGQSARVARINLPNFLRELTEGVFQINRGFFHTLRALFVRPGLAIREYLAGKRKRHFKPIAYALTLSTVYFLFSQLTETGTLANDFAKGYANGLDLSDSKNNQMATLEWFAKNYAYTTLLLLPVFSLTTFLAFRNTGYNYLEHVVLNAYITGQQAIIYAIAAILIFITKQEDLFVNTALVISVGYAFWVFWQFFTQPSRVGVVLRSMLSYLLFVLMMGLGIMVIFFATRA